MDMAFIHMGMDTGMKAIGNKERDLEKQLYPAHAFKATPNLTITLK